MTIKKVLVTGATGKTGSLVLQKLRQRPNEFAAIGLARSPEKVQELFGTTDGFYFGDIRDPASLRAALQGCQVLVILTSAIPKMVAPLSVGEKPSFEFEPGAMPETVDWVGQKHQIDVAREVGIEHIILVGSMGGTNENHPLNRMGNGNILLWKRQAEQYLIDSGIHYTIVRAGGLLDRSGGMRELLVGKDDAFMTNPPDGIPTSIPRADVAEVVVRAIGEDKAIDKAFDLISKPEDDPSATITTDFTVLFAQATPGL